MIATPNFTDSEQEEIELGYRLIQRTVVDNPYIPIMPTPLQGVFLSAPDLEIMYGGAGGGGKSVALLAAALQYVQTPGYSALLLRRTFQDLELPDALIPLAHEWLDETDAKWNGQSHQWTFPSGATVNFGYLENERDKFRYKGARFNFIGFDELTGFTETQYRYLFSRIRRRAGVKIPARMRSATNPGDIGHEWVKSRFIDADEPGRLFIPAKLEDNPYLDAKDYRDSLKELDYLTRAQMEHGDWEVRPEGNLFKREWFNGKIIDDEPKCVAVCRAWDLAGSKNAGTGDPDYAVGAKVGRLEDGNFVLLHLARIRGTPNDVKKLVRSTAEEDGVEVTIKIEQEAGSSGLAVVEAYQKDVLPEYAVYGERPTGDKVTRATPFSSKCEAGFVQIVRGPWVANFLDELCAFPLVAHDDQVDATCYGFNYIASDAFSPRPMSSPVVFAPASRGFRRF